MKKCGRPRTRPETKSVSYRLRRDLVTRLKSTSVMLGVSDTRVVEKLLDRHALPAT